MKKLFLLLTLFATLPAAAEDDSNTITGKFAGAAFASVVDLNGNGFGARQFDLRVYDTLKLIALQGFADTALVAVPGDPASTCGPTEFELEPSGRFILRGWRDDAIYAEIDSSVHLCFDPANPDETLVFNVIAGRGKYAGATGTGFARLFDAVLLATPEGFPLLVDSQGEISVTLD